MRISNVNSTNSQNFKAVNKKYFDWAKKDFSLERNVSTD